MYKSCFFDIEARSVNMKREILGKTISLFIASLLLFPSLSVQLCEGVELSQNTCCCCCCCQDSESFLANEDAAADDCSCEITEKDTKESSPAVVIFRNDSGPETFVLASEVEGINEDHQSQLGGLSLHSYSLFKKDQPLYILHSSFLI